MVDSWFIASKTERKFDYFDDENLSIISNEISPISKKKSNIFLEPPIYRSTINILPRKNKHNPKPSSRPGNPFLSRQATNTRPIFHQPGQLQNQAGPIQAKPARHLPKNCPDSWIPYHKCNEDCILLINAII